MSGKADSKSLTAWRVPERLCLTPLRILPRQRCKVLRIGEPLEAMHGPGSDLLD